MCYSEAGTLLSLFCLHKQSVLNNTNNVTNVQYTVNWVITLFGFCILLIILVVFF